MQLDPIGTVHSPVSQGVDEDWGSVISQIDLAPEYADALDGLEGFSHALIIFHMHEATFTPESDLKRRPRGRDDMPLVGILAQRAKHRPNPIGVTAVEIVTVEGSRLSVRGLDAINGTPVLDIKPYVPAFDLRSTATIPEWMERLMKGYF